jgi:hypothetical protein
MDVSRPHPLVVTVRAIAVHLPPGDDTFSDQVVFAQPARERLNRTAVKVKVRDNMQISGLCCINPRLRGARRAKALG